MTVGLDSRADSATLEAALLGHPAIEDCAVLSLRTEAGEAHCVAYVVLADTVPFERWQADVIEMLPSDSRPAAWVPVACIPRTAAGTVDEHALSGVPVIDADVVRRWEERARSVPGVERVAVVIRERRESAHAFHLADLLPGVRGSRDGPAESASAGSARATRERPPTTALAATQGEPLREDREAPTTLPAAVRRAARGSSTRGVVHLLGDGLETLESYPQLVEAAERVLAGLRAAGLRSGEKVIFQLDRNDDFLHAFWGCVLGGVVPVPIAVAPSYSDRNSIVNKLFNAWEMLGKPLILAGASNAAAVQSVAGLLGITGFRVENINELSAVQPDHDWHPSNPDDLALLLLTSGSTGAPKAVMHTHRSLLSWSAAVAQMNGFGPDDTSLNWLPLDHVGGLVMFHIRDVFLGCHQVHCATEDVLRDPLKWLDWIDRYRATITWAPNFAYGLVNDRAGEVARRRWDLRTMRFILNGGESIVPKTARRFMQLLSPHGLPATAMHPAWGMSETSSGVVFSDRFSVETTSDDDAFVELGKPVPGFCMRIVDERGSVMNEGTIGQLEVKGPSVTQGYYENPGLNRGAFAPDGWFRAGDLGFIRDGHLTITGRQKDVIIINGANYYAHEIEAVVEEVEGIETSFTAACAVRAGGSDTDGLAIFFHTRIGGDDALAELLRKIRRQVVTKAGVTPAYLLPIAPHDIPKTAIGKIQHSLLRQRLESGDLDPIVKRVDVLLENANALPRWFYRKVWRRKEATPGPGLAAGACVLFCDQLGVAERLRARLQRMGRACVVVEAGAEFAALRHGHFRIDPSQPEHYDRIVSAMIAGHTRIAAAVHLWTYQEPTDETLTEADFQRAHDLGVQSVLSWTQALARAQADSGPVRMLVVSSYAQRVDPDDRIAYEKGAISGLAKTIPQELPWADCRQVDLVPGDAPGGANCLLTELTTAARDREVAYRGGWRWVSALEEVDLPKAPDTGLPFKRGGMYLLAGGLGGIGVEIAKYLLEHYDARLILVGRTALATGESGDEEQVGGSRGAERGRAYRQLAQSAGHIRYAVADVCDLGALRRAVEEAGAAWNSELDGVIHLAGTYRERPLLEETREGLSEALTPKLLGAWNLQQLLRSRAGTVFIGFSSVNAFFGGFAAGAYAAANSALESFLQYLGDGGTRSYCYAWSLWDEVGMSRGYRLTNLAHARGYRTLSARHGISSLLAGLLRGQVRLLVGLDGANPHVSGKVIDGARPRQALDGYFTADSGRVRAEDLEDLAVADRFGRPSACNFRRVAALPLTSTGEVAWQALAPAQRSDAYVAPRSQVEEMVAVIWREVLRRDRVGVHENFFELGGDSLRATMVLSRLRAATQLDVPLGGMFETPTVEGLALRVVQQRAAGTDDAALERTLAEVEHMAQVR